MPAAAGVSRQGAVSAIVAGERSRLLCGQLSLMSAPVILVEATPRRAADAAPVTVRLAGGGASAPYFYDQQHWRAGIAGLPKTIAALNFDGQQLGGGGTSQAMELSWGAASTAALAELSALYWDDAPIVVRVGPEGQGLPPIVTRGLVGQAPVERGVLKIAMADNLTDLNRPLLVDRFAGTGGLEGPPEFADLIKSRAWGRCFNVPGRQIDAAHHIWCFGDPNRSWAAFDQVRDKGVAPDLAAMTLLPPGASAAATFAALQAAQVIEGGGVCCPSIACVKWWKEPSGDLHADIRGETAGGYVETAPEIVARIVADRSALAFAAGTVAGAVAARSAPFGWRVDNDSTTAAAEISELLGGVSLSWLLVDDAIIFCPWDWTAPRRVARSFAVTRKSTVKPVGSRKLGYRRNWSPMARGDLAAIVLAQDVAYADGTPVEELKPAEAGATNSASPNSPLGPDGKTVQQVLDDLDLNSEAIIRQLLTADQIQRYNIARTTLEGKPVGTVLLEERAERIEGLEAVANTFLLLGAISADNTAFILDINTVKATPTSSLASAFKQLIAGDSSISELNEVLHGPAGDEVRAVFKLDVNGNISGIVQTNNGATSDFSIIANRLIFVDPNGGNPRIPFKIENGILKATDVEVDRFKVGSISYMGIAPNQIVGKIFYQDSWAGGIAVDQVGGASQVWQQYGTTAKPAKVSRTLPNNAVVAVRMFVNFQRTGGDNDRTWFRLRKDGGLLGTSYVGDIIRAGAANYPTVVTYEWTDTITRDDTYTYSLEIYLDEGLGTHFSAKLILDSGNR
jgi:hypothetical protein